MTNFVAVTDTPGGRSDTEAFLDWSAENPAGWLEKVLGQSLWQKQVEMAVAIRDHPQVAVKSCHASGKTYLAGSLALWWVYSHPGAAMCLMTAPTFRQVIDNPWAELQKSWLGAKVPLSPGGQVRPLETGQLKLGPRWGIRAFATDRPVNWSGFHQDYVLIIVDEASGVDAATFESIEGLRSSGHIVRLLLLSQGTDTAGTFFNAFHKDREFWHCITLAADDTPNFAPDVLQAWREAGSPVDGYRFPYSYLISPSWVERVGKQYGTDSDFYRVRVLGEFPSGDPNALLSLAKVEAATKRVLMPPADPQTWIGLDVARFGDDDSAIVVRRGPVVLYYESRHGADTVAVAGWATEIARRFGATDINVDEVGVGGGPVDILKANQPNGVRIHGISAGAAARDKERFMRLRDEMLWGLRERFETSDLSLANLDRSDQERLVPELTGLKYRYTASGKIEVESKDDYKGRLGRSPDAADALMLAFAKPADDVMVFSVSNDPTGFFTDPDW